MKKISILGSTGSIGKQALEVVSLNKDMFEVVGLAEGHDVKLLALQIEKYKPQVVSVRDKSSAVELKSLLKNHKPKIVHGIDGAIEVASLKDADLVLSAIVGAIGLLPTMSAIDAGKAIALANKETLVAGGAVVARRAKEKNVQFIPVDSEHSAIFQSMMGHRKEDLKKIILTASGGPFRKFSLKELEDVKVEDALKHPNWDMGAKITIDSSTLMNKGLEVIEARWLFDVKPQDIEVVVHPQSIIHSMVEYIDGIVIAQLGLPNMQTPIAFALGYPNRINSGIKAPFFAEIARLDFEKPDLEKFPALKLAYDALNSGESMPAVMNAANEVAVKAFLDKKIKFTQIPKIVESVMKQHSPVNLTSIDDVLKNDLFGRNKAKELIDNL